MALQQHHHLLLGLTGECAPFFCEAATGGTRLTEALDPSVFLLRSLLRLKVYFYILYQRCVLWPLALASLFS